jgi:hypothetical protein
MLSLDRFFGVFILLFAGMIAGFVILVLEWFIFKYAVPYWRRHRWLGWMFCSQVSIRKATFKLASVFIDSVSMPF